jgi:outer membrane receptor protein involved in Fe transport
VAALAFAPRASAQAAEESFDIPEQRADLALNEFARQAHLVVLFPYEEVSRVAANRLSGKFTVKDGVEALLRNTGLAASVEAGGRQLVVRVFAADSTGGSTQMGFQQRRGVFASVMAALAALAGTNRASAQDGEAPAALEEVTVTGSRIHETGMNTPVPVTVVTADQLDQAAPGSLIEAFHQMPQFLGNSSPGTDVFIGTNAGQSILNMRGLGQNRTLTLLDGRRVVPSTKQGTLDINVLPESMIKRVEVVTGGASAAYGTDAVAGVTNFILDTDFTGWKGHVQGGETTRGDNANGEGSLAFGTAIGERAHLITSIDYYKSKAIETYDGRDWMQDWGTVLNPAWSPGSSQPQYIVQPHVTSTLYTFGGVINSPGTPLNQMMFLSDGSAVPFVPGSIANFNSTYLRSQTGGVGDNIERDRASDAGLIPNVERYNGFAHLKYSLNDNWEAFGQVLLGRNKVDGNGFADVMHGPAFQGTIYSGNPYLPANVQQVMTANNIASFNLSRMGSSADLSVDRLIQTNQTDSYTAGLKGMVGDWRVNTYYQYGRNEGEMRAVNFPRTDRLFLAMDAVIDPGTGAITCNVNLANPGYGCIPINLLGSGRASRQAIEYVTAGTKTANTVNKQNAFELSVDGEIFKGWAPGPVSLAVGVDYRKDELRQVVDDPSNPTNSPSYVAVPVNNPARNIRGIPVGFAGVNSGVQFSIVPNFSGEITVKEAFTEVLVPLLKDLTFARQLNLSAAARYADYTGSGGIWSWKGGLDWQALDALRLRGTVSRDVRAANMSERFDSAGGGATVRDPFLPGNPLVNFTQITGGNPNVDPEKADTLTFGVVVQPPQVQGLQMSVDWYSIDVKGSIGQLSAQQIVDSCHGGNTALCSRITRDANGQISGLQNLYLNINAARVMGTDMEVDYNHHVGAGQLGVRLLASWLGENSITNFGLPKQDRAGETGALSFPEWQGVANLNYSQGPFTAFVQERYIGSGKRRFNDNLPPAYGGITIDDDRVSPMYYTDVQGSYTFDLQKESSLEVFLNVTNLFDRDPPIAANYSDFGGSVQTNANLFDVLGRRFVLGARFNF